MSDIIPRHYALRLEPDLETFELKGRTAIQLELRTAAQEIALHAVELDIVSCTVVHEGAAPVPAEFSSPDERTQSFTITLPREMRGKLRLDIEHTGLINDTMLGFYRSRYRDEQGNERYVAVTQFEETEARKAFPCFDRPDLKATFDVSFIIDRALRGISNMPVASEEALPGNRKLVRFARTPVMSTYLLFFGVGTFECLEDPGEPLVRAFTTPGKIELAADGIRFARFCLGYLTEHFGTAYPLPKLDLIAVPDFAFGAMENWGAMTFRENLMLVYPGITSRASLQRLYEVIAHEIVHQWFGDLVSPADWKYLWLNESFATLYGFLAVEKRYPEWRTMETYLLETTASALGRDALPSTFPIELEEGARITASTAPIIYDKGGSLLRMAVDWLGETVRKSLADYFSRHAYGSAVSSDLWEAFGRTAGDDTVSAMMKSWVKRPGYPLLRVQRRGDDLRITQERFSYSGEEPEAGEWIIPLSLIQYDERGGTRNTKKLLRGSSGEVSLNAGTVACKLNAGQSGFYRVAYEPEELERLGRLAASDALSGADRYGLQDDLFALVRRGERTLPDYLGFIGRHFREERHHLPLLGILRNLSLLNLILEDESRGPVREAGRILAEHALAHTGLEPAEGEPLPTAALRSDALWRGVLFGSGMAVDFCRTEFSRSLSGKESLHPDTADAVRKAAAFSDPEAFPPMMESFIRSESEEERMMLSVALGCVPPGHMAAAVDFAFEKIPPALRFVPFMVMSGNPQLAPLVWDMFLDNRERLETLHAAHFERVVIGIISTGGLGREPEVRRFFADYAPESLKSYSKYFRESLDMALEILTVNTRLRGA